MSDERIVAFDTETRGLDWFDEDQRAFLASWADANGEYHCDLSRPEDTQRFLDALQSADVLVAHNLAFDVHHVREATGLDLLRGGARLEDTDLMSRVLFPEGQRKGERGGHGLKNLATVWLDAGAREAEEKIEEMASAAGIKLRETGGYFDTWRAYPQEMEHYARMDARYTYDLYQRFQGEFDDKSRRVYALEMEVAPVLIAAEQRGVAVDGARVDALVREYRDRRDELRGGLEAALGSEALGGAGSEDALLDALLGMGVPLYRKTATGKVATNIYALQEFEPKFPVLAELSEFRQCEKFLSTYLEPLVGRETVHPSFMQCGAWTGRMSCRRPNMQNIPKRAGKEVREVFVPREGHSFVVYDYEGIEARLLAYYLGDEGYRALFEGGHDPHAWMAAKIANDGRTAADFAKGTPGEDDRAVAKNTTFAIIYGAGAPRVSDMNQIPKAQAKELIASIKASLPGFRRLQKRVRNKIESVGHVNTLIGRTQPVNRDKSYVGLNALIQGSAADLMKQGLVNAAKAIEDLDAHPLLVVHDEVVVEVPTEHAEECARRVEQALVDAYELSPALSVEGSVVDTNYAAAA